MLNYVHIVKNNLVKMIYPHKGFPGNGTHCWNADECELEQHDCADTGKVQKLTLSVLMLRYYTIFEVQILIIV